MSVNGAMNQTAPTGHAIRQPRLVGSCGTACKTRSMIWSTVMPSASALKVGTMRWRKTGCARPRYPQAPHSDVRKMARTLPPRINCWQARGPGPQLINPRERQRLSIIGPTTTHNPVHKHSRDRHRHFTHDLLALDNFIAVDHRLNGIIMHTGGTANDFRFLFSIGVIDLDVKHEAVLLRLRS